jgi:hypothetical protein
MRASIWCLAFAAPLLPWAARGQDEAAWPPTVITIRPAASPVPALRYSLLPKAGDQIPGNAAIFYHRAIEIAMSVRSHRAFLDRHLNKPQKESDAAEQEAHTNWQTMPVATLPRDAVRKFLEQYSLSLHEIELGARRESCDWEFQRRDEGFTMMFEDLQEMRGLGRLLVLKIRLEIAEGRIDSAIHWLQTGFAMARHVGGQSNSLIQMLISSAMTSQMTILLEELIQTPGAPNLYWAVVNLPRPFIDVTTAYEGEKHLLEKEFPQLNTVDGTPWSMEQARVFSDDFHKKMAMLSGDLARTSSSSTQPDMKDLGSHLLFTAMIARAYPEAKRSLLAQGRSAAEVEAMPTVQAVALHSYRLYQEARDDIFKWIGLPYWQGYRGMNDAEQKPRAGWNTLKGGIPFAIVLPAIRSAYVVASRVDRQLDVVQTLEAIRLFAAGHQGALPPSLDAITEAPVPIDPSTGKPFNYKVDGTTATLTAPPPPGYEGVPQYKIHYELKLAR